MHRGTDEPNLVQQCTLLEQYVQQFILNLTVTEGTAYYLNLILSKRDCPLFAEQNKLAHCLCIADVDYGNGCKFIRSSLICSQYYAIQILAQGSTIFSINPNCRLVPKFNKKDLDMRFKKITKTNLN